MKKKMAKFLAVLMCLMTAVAFMPTFAFAAEVEEPAELFPEQGTTEAVDEPQEEPADPEAEDTELPVAAPQGISTLSDPVTISVTVNGADKGSALGVETLNVSSDAFDENEEEAVTFADVITAYCVHIGKTVKIYYNSNYSSWSLSELFGDKSGAYGYYINNNSAWSASDVVKNGDVVTAFVYAANDWSDKYTWFGESTYFGNEDESNGIKLMAAGFDESWNQISVPCKGAKVTVTKEGEDTITATTDTDTDGIAEFDGLEAGEYKVEALSDSTTIVPPVPCTLIVSAAPAENTVEKLNADKRAAIDNLSYDLSKYRIAEKVNILSFAVKTISEINAASGKNAINTAVSEFDKSVAALNTDTQYKNVEYYTKSAMKLTKVSAGKKKAKAYWKKNSKFSSYQVYYKKSGSSGKPTTARASSTTKTIIKLTKKKKYTLKIRGCKVLPNDSVKYGSYAGKTVYGTWSNSKTVKIK